MKLPAGNPAVKIVSTNNRYDMDWLSWTWACRTECAVSSWQLPYYPIWRTDARSLQSCCWQMLKKVKKMGKLRKGRMITIELIEYRTLVYFAYVTYIRQWKQTHWSTVLFRITFSHFCVCRNVDRFRLLPLYLPIFLSVPARFCNSKFCWYCRGDNSLWCFYSIVQ